MSQSKIFRRIPLESCPPGKIIVASPGAISVDLSGLDVSFGFERTESGYRCKTTVTGGRLRVHPKMIGIIGNIQPFDPDDVDDDLPHIFNLGDAPAKKSDDQ